MVPESTSGYEYFELVEDCHTRKICGRALLAVSALGRACRISTDLLLIRWSCLAGILRRRTGGKC